MRSSQGPRPIHQFDLNGLFTGPSSSGTPSGGAVTCMGRGGAETYSWLRPRRSATCGGKEGKEGNAYKGFNSFHGSSGFNSFNGFHGYNKGHGIQKKKEGRINEQSRAFTDCKKHQHKRTITSIH